MRVAALFLGLIAGLFALLAPSALKIDLMSSFLDAWSSTPGERLVGTIVWYAIPAAALLGGVLATVTPGFAALLLTAAAAGWVGIGLMLPELFDFKLIAPAASAGFGALVALIAGELEIRRKRVARRQRRAATAAFAEDGEIEREAALRMDPLLVPHSEAPPAPKRVVPLTLEDVSVTARPASPPPRWQDLDAPSPEQRKPDAWGEAMREEAEPTSPAPVVPVSRRRGFTWDRTDAPAGQRFEPDPAPSPRLEPRRTEQVRRADPLRIDEQMLPDPEAEGAPVAAPQRLTRRRAGVLAPVLAAVAAVVVLGAVGAGGYFAYREGWVDRVVAMIPRPPSRAPEQPAAASDQPSVEPVAPTPAETAAVPAARLPSVPADAIAVAAVTPPATSAAPSYADPFAYCRAVGTIDHVDGRYQGPVMTDAIVRALSLTAESNPDRVRWRCLRGSVLACTSYVGPVCDITPSVDEMRAFCVTHADVPQLMAPAGTWACKGGRPEIPAGARWPVDERGFLPSSWVVVLSAS